MIGPALFGLSAAGREGPGFHYRRRTGTRPDLDAATLTATSQVRPRSFRTTIMTYAGLKDAKKRADLDRLSVNVGVDAVPPSARRRGITGDHRAQHTGGNRACPKGL